MTPPNKRKPSDPSWLLSHVPAAPADATRVTNGPPDLTRFARSIGPATPGNRPLPEATVQSAHQPRYDKAMGVLADMIPVLGSLRGVRAGHDLAQAGSPLMGAATAALSVLPEAGGAVGRALPEVAQFAQLKPEEFHAALSQFAEALAHANRPIDPVRVGANLSPENMAMREQLNRMVARNPVRGTTPPMGGLLSY